MTLLAIKYLAVLILLLSLFPTTSVKSEEISSSRIVFTELQTESTLNALDDFIELTNRTEENIDVTGWEIQTKATGVTSDWIKRVELDGIIYAGGSIIISYSNDQYSYLSDIASGYFSTGLSTTGGHIRLMDTNNAVEEDKLGWGTAADPELLPAPKPLNPESLSRRVVDGEIIDTNNNLADFELREPSPRADNFAPEEEPPIEEPPEEEPPEEEPPIEEPPEEEPPIEEPPIEEPPIIEEEVSLPELALIINEIFPDPETPQTDAMDEWIEIYNPNTQAVSLRDYKLQTGSSFSYSYTFPDIEIAPLGYISVSSGESNLVLSNSGGAVKLLDYLGGVMDVLDNYADVSTGQSYAWDGLFWQWTTTPTRDQENIITAKIVEPKIVSTAKKSIRKTSTKSKSKRKAKTYVKSSKSSASSTRDVYEDPMAIDTDPPLHPGVLAGTGVLAILYGGYEYREDFQNKLFRARRYLQVRRTNRQKIARRRNY